MLVQVSSGILPYSALDSTFLIFSIFLLHHRIIKLDTQIEFLALGAIDASLGGGINVLIRWRCGECAIRLVIFYRSMYGCFQTLSGKMYRLIFYFATNIFSISMSKNSPKSYIENLCFCAKLSAKKSQFIFIISRVIEDPENGPNPSRKWAQKFLFCKNRFSGE